jgi:hypothetical protein
LERGVFLDASKIHELSIAYAQVKLINYQKEYGKSCDEQELYEFAKAYQFALDNFENAFDQIG